MSMCLLSPSVPDVPSRQLPVCLCFWSRYQIKEYIYIRTGVNFRTFYIERFSTGIRWIIVAYRLCLNTWSWTKTNWVGSHCSLFPLFGLNSLWCWLNTHSPRHNVATCSLTVFHPQHTATEPQALHVTFIRSHWLQLLQRLVHLWESSGPLQWWWWFRGASALHGPEGHFLYLLKTSPINKLNWSST